MNMANKNTMGKFSYIINTVFWSVCVFFMYKTFCVLCLPQKNFEENIESLIIFAAVWTIWGIIITIGDKRNYLNIMVNAIFPYGLNSVMFMYEFYPAGVTVTVILASLVCCFFFFMVITRPRKSPNTSLFCVIVFRFKHCLMGARLIVALCAFVLIVPVVITTLHSETVAVKEVPKVWTIDSNIKTLTLLDEDEWETLSLTDKLDVADTVKNIELKSLGITEGVPLIVMDLEEDVAGCYSPSSNTIVIDSDYMCGADSADIVRTLCHECFHAYQHHMVDIYENVPELCKEMQVFSSAKGYAYEFENYIDGDEDYEAYKNQAVEEDARIYSTLKRDFYFEKIDAYYAALNG